MSKLSQENPHRCTAQSGAIDAMLFPAYDAMSSSLRLAEIIRAYDAMSSSLRLVEIIRAYDAMSSSLRLVEINKAYNAMAFPSLELAKLAQDLQNQDSVLKQAMKSCLPDPYFKDNLFLPTLASPPREIPYTDIVNEREIGNAQQKTAPTKEQVNQRFQDNLAKLALVKEFILLGRVTVDFFALVGMSVTPKRWDNKPN